MKKCIYILVLIILNTYTIFKNNNLVKEQKTELENNIDKALNILSNNNNNNLRYKNYIPYNIDVVTKYNAKFYDEDGYLFSLDREYQGPLIIKDTDKYGILMDDYLVYVNYDDVKELLDSDNTKKTNTKSIPVMNYHFIYKEGNRGNCYSEICISENLFREHLTYLKENNIYTVTMEEFEMYLDNKIQLPQSVLLTCDDGMMGENFRDILSEYKLNGTLFLITSEYNFLDFKGEYLEIHSHGDNIHNQGICTGGQGGAIKCQEYNSLLKDLQISREKTNFSTAFAYPFYEYNNYSIKVLKDAGFTLAFAGENTKCLYAFPGIDKFQIPRLVMVNYTDIDTFSKYINLK